MTQEDFAVPNVKSILLSFGSFLKKGWTLEKSTQQQHNQHQNSRAIMQLTSPCENYGTPSEFLQVVEEKCKTDNLFSKLLLTVLPFTGTASPYLVWDQYQCSLASSKHKSSGRTDVSLPHLGSSGTRDGSGITSSRFLSSSVGCLMGRGP